MFFAFLSAAFCNILQPLSYEQPSFSNAICTDPKALNTQSTQGKELSEYHYPSTAQVAGGGFATPWGSDLTFSPQTFPKVPHHGLLCLQGLPHLESTRTARTRTPKPLYTRDIPRKKHLIHPLNNSDNSILSPIYMFQTR